MAKHDPTYGRFVRLDDITLKASGAETASTNGTAVQPAMLPQGVQLYLDVTAASGTSPTLDVAVQGTVDGTNYISLGTFTQKTAAGAERKVFSTFGCRKLRYASTIGGTSPSFTYSLTGEVSY